MKTAGVIMKEVYLILEGAEYENFGQMWEHFRTNAPKDVVQELIKETVEEVDNSNDKDHEKFEGFREEEISFILTSKLEVKGYDVEYPEILGFFNI